MNIFQLSCFLAVAESLSFARAAEQMNVSQPAITHQIKALESELNVRLFNRSTRLVELTAEGRAFVPDAKGMVTIAERARLRFSTPGEQALRFLSIGSGSYHQLALLAGSLNELARTVENLHPRLQVVPQDQQFHMLDTEALDLVFAVRQETESKRKLLFRELYRSPMACVCRRDHPLSALEAVTPEELRNEPLIFSDPLSLSPEIAEIQWKLAEGRTPADIHFSASPDASLVLALAGFGAAILPELLVPPGNDIVKVPILGTPAVSLGLFFRSDPGDQVLREFIRIAQRHFAAPGAGGDGQRETPAPAPGC